MPRNLRAINIFSSKVASAHRYPPPRHDVIVEPFAGGAGYSLLHYERDVVLVDADPAIIGVWQYLIASDPEEVLSLPLIEPDQDVAELECSEGGRLLISWCLNQTATPRRKLSSWGVYHAGRACYWGERRRAQAALISRRIGHWCAYLASYEWAPNIRADWFIDPPYVDGGKSYRHNTVDYQALAAWARSRKGQVIACERNGADWLPFQMLYDAPTAKRYAKGKRQRCSEAVWIGGGRG